ncbi:MAG TPA: multicopper oxidase domain-containing protein, partial [Candidatus Binatia bacterium]|nr:multicopper oxidase domain-containing protein [Candidatus Binatia bacterium]
YYIAAEDVTWNYAPSGMNLLNAEPIRQPWSLKLQWPKTRFIEYTDDTFSTKKPQPEWLGILGPIIRAEVGDEVVVEFLNRAHLGHDMHPHGLRYDKDNEGSFYIPFGKGDRVAPGRKFTYHWFATPASGPGPGQPSSIVWWYHAHVDPNIEVNAGLIGPIIVTAKGKAKPDGSPKDVDREFVTSFQIFDEMGGKQAGLFYSINGFIFGNLPGLVMKQGEKVRWHLLAMGNEIDLHTPHWHGLTVVEDRHNTDVVELLPGSMKTVDLIADNPGTWMFHCHVEDHMEGGMMAVFTIYKPQTQPCPVTFTALTFWNSPEKNTLTVKNTSGKTIAQASIISEMFMAPQDLRRPFQPEWRTTEQIWPGQEQTIEKPGLRGESAKAVLGWTFFPVSVKYQDGSSWAAQNEGECFKVFWRDADRPDLPVLPPRQFEISPD